LPAAAPGRPAPGAERGGGGAGGRDRDRDVRGDGGGSGLLAGAARFGPRRPLDEPCRHTAGEAGAPLRRAARRQGDPGSRQVLPLGGRDRALRGGADAQALPAARFGSQGPPRAPSGTPRHLLASSEARGGRLGALAPSALWRAEKPSLTLGPSGVIL